MRPALEVNATPALPAIVATTRAKCAQHGRQASELRRPYTLTLVLSAEQLAWLGSIAELDRLPSPSEVCGMVHGALNIAIEKAQEPYQ